jgi:Bifunctional DNA primase/polymerase, N-terminal
MSDRERYALAYARHGMRVFPCHEIERDGFCSCGAMACKSPGKHPRIKDWQQLATVDERQIRTWWRNWHSANIGVKCGADSSLTVLDIDPRHGGDASLAEAQHGKLPETPIAITGGGGNHYLFQHVPGLTNAVSIAPGLDIRTEGGLIIGVGSKTSGEYEWEASAAISDDPDDPLVPAEMPQWLIDPHQAAQR